MTKQKQSSQWVDLSTGVNLDYLQEQTAKGVRIFGFMQDGSINHYVITEIDKKKQKYWAVRTTLYDESEDGGLEQRK